MITSIRGQIAVRALRNRQLVEQFLGATDPSGPPGIAYVSIWPYPGPRWRYAITLYEMVEVEGFTGDLEDLPSLDPRVGRGTGRDLVLRDTPRAALEYAERVTGAVQDRWVSPFKVYDQYADWVEAGRPPLR